MRGANGSHEINAEVSALSLSFSQPLNGKPDGRPRYARDNSSRQFLETFPRTRLTGVEKLSLIQLQPTAPRSCSVERDVTPLSLGGKGGGRERDVAPLSRAAGQKADAQLQLNLKP